MKRVVSLVENSDRDCIYGNIIINQNISCEEVQEKIYEIKGSEEDIFANGDYTIEDIIERFPSDWDFEYVDGNEMVEV